MAWPCMVAMSWFDTLLMLHVAQITWVREVRREVAARSCGTAAEYSVLLDDQVAAL
jgi:hypothetical protein